MNWFGGSVAEAIQTAKSRRGLFIVFICGEDETSQQMNQNWDDSTVVELMSASNSVAIRLDPNSPTGQQFSQIYPIMCVPCVYFIGILGGVPLEVQGGLLEPVKIVDAFNTALQLHLSQTSNAPPAPVQKNDAGSGAPALVQKNDTGSGAPAPVQKGAAGSVADAGMKEMSTTSDDASASKPTESAEEKKERAKILLAMRREQKTEEERETQKQKEAERRKVGQEMGKLKDWKEEMERKEYETSMKKEKLEAKLAREKVLADLQRDREEKNLKYSAEKTARELEVQKKKDATSAAAAASVATTTAERRESARIQFRLPDGSTVTQTFKSSANLSEARQFILRKLNVNTVTLLSTYPRRTFTDEDMSTTMLDLNLAPTAALVVLLAGSSRQPPGCNQGFIATILAYLFLIWAFLCNLFSGAPSPAVATTTRDGQQENARHRDAAAASGRTGAVTDSGVRQRDRAKQSDGNIHRLHNADDSDDENATWNGNSTQQK